jgi:hypothetical protein
LKCTGRANLRRKWSTIPKTAAFHNEPSRFTVWLLFVLPRSRFFEIARVLVRLDHVAGIIINANHSIM